jgi:hypothetical protein
LGDAGRGVPLRTAAGPQAEVQTRGRQRNARTNAHTPRCLRKASRETPALLRGTKALLRLVGSVVTAILLILPCGRQDAFAQTIAEPLSAIVPATADAEYSEDFEGAANPAFRFTIDGAATMEIVDASAFPGMSGVSGKVLYYTQHVISTYGGAGLRIDVPPDTRTLSFDMASKLLPQIAGNPFCDWESAVVFSHSGGFGRTVTPSGSGPQPFHPNCPPWLSGHFEISREPEGYRTDYYTIVNYQQGHTGATDLLAAALAFDNFHIVTEPCPTPTTPRFLGIPTTIPDGGNLTVSWTPADNLPSDGDHHYVLQVAQNPSFAPYLVFRSTDQTSMTFSVPQSVSNYTLYIGVWSYRICTVTGPWVQSPASFRTINVIGGTSRPPVLSVPKLSSPRTVSPRG